MNAKKIISLILVLSLTLTFTISSKRKAHADALTLVGLSAAAYAMSQSFGMSFLPTDGTVQGVQNFMNNRILNKLGGASLTEYFEGEMLRVAAGKLIIPVKIYGFLKSVIEDIKSANGITEGGEAKVISTGGTLGCVLTPLGQIGQGTIGDKNYNRLQINPINGGGLFNITYAGDGYYKYYLEGNNFYTKQAAGVTGFIFQEVRTNTYEVNLVTENTNTKLWGLTGQKQFTYAGSVDTEMLAQIPATYYSPNVDVGYQWEGTINGSTPDTNLDQLIGEIYDSVVDLDLTSEGEVTEVQPIPPTPGPIDPDIPLSNVPWGGLDDSLTGIDTNLGQIYESLNDGVGHDVIGELTDINTAIGDLSDAVGYDVIGAINEQTQTLSESQTATAEAAGTIAEALEDEAIDWQKFDLRGLFPFCIPFDIYNMLQALDASPTAPHVQIPFVIESIGFSYNIDLDFSEFDQVAAVMRQMELIVYGIALAWATSKVIKW